MEAFLGVISMFIILISIVWLTVNLIKRNKKKKPLLWLSAGLVLFIFALAITPENASTNGYDDDDEPIVQNPVQPTETHPIETTSPPATIKPEKPSMDETAQDTLPAPSVAAEELKTESPIVLEKATIIDVVDGDTVDIKLQDGTEDRVRMIGIDTPESTTRQEPYGQEASDFTKVELYGKTVYLEKDIVDRDRFGRLLRYVWLAEPKEISGQEIRSNLFNAILLLRGYARVATFPPNVKYVNYFTSFQTEARNTSAGLWGVEETGAE